MFPRLLILFIGVPLIEFMLFFKIGSRIGLTATIATIVLTGIIGAWLTKQQGLRTLRRYQESMSMGKLPHEEVVEGLMILVAGAVLLTPGFLTDAIGFALLIPPVRAALRSTVAQYLKGKVQVAGASMPGVTVEPGQPVRQVEAEVIDVDVVVEDRDTHH